MIALVLVLAWGIGSGFSFADGVRHRLRPHLHDDGRPGRGLAARHPGRLRAGRDRLAPAPQAPGLVWLVVVLCPIIAIVGQVFAIYLLFKNIDVLAGTIGYVDLIGPIAIIGVLIGARLRVLPQARPTARSSTWSAG